MAKRARTLSASLEDYMEAIFHIASGGSAARAKDIAGALGVSRPSVTGALRALAGRGLVHYAPYGAVTLTRAGLAAAKDVIRRHEALRTFLTDVLGVDREAAERAACRMEHALPPAALERLVRFLRPGARCPCCGRRNPGPAHKVKDDRKPRRTGAPARRGRR